MKLKTSEPIPIRMQSLPVDDRGYVVPWFVDWIDGKPEFRAMDPRKWKRAVQNKLCWVCGERLGRWLTFVAGPMCGINRTTSEPPCHLECAEWSARNCPFLSNPEQIRREDETTAAAQPIGGFGLKRNPGVTMLWTSKDYFLFDDGRGGRLITMGEPEHVQWYAEGRPASRAQVVASVDSGLPNLENLARQEAGGLEYLRACRERFEKYLPHV